jgi:hypothetical protein
MSSSGGLTVSDVAFFYILRFGWTALSVATSALCFLIAIVLLARHLIKPRRLGDMSYLSWQTQDSATGSATAAAKR